MKEAQLEQKFLFRLIKATYVIAFLFLLAFIGILGWVQKPYQYIDDDKSLVTCLPNNKTYSYSTVDDYINKVPNRYELDLYDQKNKANYVCERVIEDELKYREGTEGYLKYLGAKAEVFSEYDQKWFPNTPANKKIIIDNVKNKYPAGIFKTNDIYATNGSWQTVILWWVLGLISGYIVLNLIRETLMYVLLGKQFSWEWFTKIWTLLNSK